MTTPKSGSTNLSVSKSPPMNRRGDAHPGLETNVHDAFIVTVGPGNPNVGIKTKMKTPFGSDGF